MRTGPFRSICCLVGPCFFAGDVLRSFWRMETSFFGASRTVAVVLVVLVDSDSFWMGYCFVKVVFLGLWKVWNAKETSRQDF